MSQVLALKYRPKRFEDLIGQRAVSQTLSLALDSNRLSHAYLFSGLRGSGKTSTARIFAKSLLCEQGPTSTPCEVCANCKGANSGNHIDMIEMDAASNRGIDDIKDLIEHTKYKPSMAKYKIFIIDEVHMLTIQAFNALLKTLEEPPDFVKFILATTDPLKLPPTILSRTQHFRFTNIALKDIIHHLGFVLNNEQIAFDEDALEILARSGNGSLRDTLTLLDQAIIFSKNHINISSVTDMLGIIDPKFIDKIFQIILQRDTKQILSLADELIDFETSAIIDEMINYLKTQLKNKNPQFSTMIIDRFFRILSDAKSLLHINSDGEFVLLLTLNKLIEATYIKLIDDAINSLEAKIDISQIQETITQTTQLEPTKIEETISTQETPKAPTTQEEITPQIQENIIEEETKEIITEKEPIQNGQEEFNQLIKAIYDRDFEVGKCFEESIVFDSFIDNTLTWTSYADENQQKILRNAYTHIKHFVQEIFGLNTVINFKKGEKKNDPREPIPTPKLEENSPSCGSCMENSLNITSTEVDAQTILNSKMRNQIQESFGISKIRVKSKM